VAGDKTGDLYPDDDPEDFDLQDQSKILFGAQAISGKALMAGRADAQITEEIDRRKFAQRQQQQEAARAEEARQFANLQAWNKQMSSIDGLTNEQAQAARRRFIENEELYSRRAVEAGYIKPEDVPALQRGMERQYELEDKVGRGVATEAEKRSLKDWKQSDIGKVGAKITQDLGKGTGMGIDAGIQAGLSEKARSDRKLSSSGVDEKFQSAPPVKSEFTTRSDPTQTAPVSSSPPPAPARKVEATGLDL